MVRLLFSVLAISLVVVPFSFATEFHPGDEIKLSRDENLMFREQLFRQAKEGETFKVLAYRAELKKLFLAGKDSEGSDIALSVNEDAVTVVPPNPIVLLNKAVLAVEDKKLDEAMRLVQNALRFQPDDVELRKALDLVSSAKEINQRLEAAKVTLRSAQAQSDRIRANAAVVDRPNVLTRDSTNQTRASEMRRQADATEARAKAAVDTAEREIKRRIADLNEIVSSRQRQLSRITRGPLPKAGNKALSQLQELVTVDAETAGLSTSQSAEEISKIFRSIGIQEVTYQGLQTPESMQFPLIALGAVDEAGKFKAFDRGTFLGQIESDLVDFEGDPLRIKGVWTGRKSIGGEKMAHLLVVTTDYLFILMDVPQPAPVKFFLVAFKLPSGERTGYVLR